MDTTDQLAAAIREKTTAVDATPVAATVAILRAASTRTLDFDPEHLVLTPGARPPAETASYLFRLAQSAQETAFARACSSILAGESSESDDTGDVAVWLGAGDYSSADKVLDALGIGAESVATETQGAELDMMLSMGGMIRFRVEWNDSRVLFVCGGEIGGGWGGLAGVGTWT